MANTIEPSAIAYEPQWPLEFQPQTPAEPTIVVSGGVGIPPTSKDAGGPAMPGDPKECRLYAMHCAEWAEVAETQQLKTTLLDLSKDWIKLAETLESAPCLRK
jgi:hypothetical protein